MRKALSLLLPLAVAVIVLVNTVIPLTAVGTGTGQATSTNTYPVTAQLAGTDGLTPRGPITIISDANFTRENGVVAGSGTADDPYIIEGWEIDASGYDYGILIENTTAYFIIRNCKIYGSNLAGIVLANVTNGKIISNNIANNGVGIILGYSINSVIEYNNITGNIIGIYLLYSIINVIAGNNFINNLWQVYSNYSINIWDLGYPTGGNYWSDHNCIDQYSGPNQDQPGSDGICDAPYQIYDEGYGSYQYDHYPLAKPVNITPPTTTTPTTTTPITTTTPVTTSTLVFDVSDPVGDDKGQGTLLYPTNSVFQPGVFDLVRFTVLQDKDFVYLQVRVRNLGGNPWGGPNGFSLQHVQIYVMTTDKTLPVNTTTLGLNVNLAPGWNYAVVAIPGWGDTPFPDGEVSALFKADGSLVADEHNNPDLFDVYAFTDSNVIEVKISKSLLSDVNNIANWVWYVFLTSYDGYSVMRIRYVVAGDPLEWFLGGGDPLAIMAGVQPRVVDMLAPTDQDQYSMLKSYDIAAKTLAVVYGIKVSIYYPPVTVTITSTTTVTTTATMTVTTTVTTSVPTVVTVVVPTTVTTTATETKTTTVPTTVITMVPTTVTTTVTQTTTATTTIEKPTIIISKEITTVTTTSPSPTTVTTTVTTATTVVDWSTTGIAAVVLLITGLTLGYVIRRR